MFFAGVWARRVQVGERRGKLRLTSGKVCRFMDSMIVQYALFILAALLIISAVVALNRWLYRHSRPKPGAPNTWAKLDTRHADARDERSTSAILEEDEDEEEDEEEAELHVRARQNGHHSNGHAPLS